MTCGTACPAVLTAVGIAFFLYRSAGPSAPTARASRRTSATDIHASSDFLNASLVDSNTGLPNVSGLIVSSSYRRKQLEPLLRPMYASLVQQEGEDSGKLDMAAVRYVLHRLFVQRHGWQIRSLQPDASGGSVVMAYVQAVIEEMGAGGRGLHAHELATVAAVLEELTHLEAVDKLYDVFVEDHDDVINALELDWSAFAVGMTMTHNLDAATVGALVKDVWNGSSSSDWAATKFFAWLLDVQFGLVHAERHRRNPFRAGAVDFDFPDFEFAERVVEEVGERHGIWQDLECRSLKNALVGLDKKAMGRVPLPEFYGAQLWGTVPPPFQFLETEDYLRHLGALDESVRGQPSLIVPNYVNAYSNCILSTEIYSVCCIDECEGLLGKIELAIAAPAARPEQIAAVVAALPSDTVAAPRKLSASLLRRLDSIGEHSADGKVPLHGRLFAQWLHHAYPYECAYPHTVEDAAGDEVMMQTADVWLSEEHRLKGMMEVNGDEIETVYANALERHGLAEGEGGDERSGTELPWAAEDTSMFAPRPKAAGGRRSSEFGWLSTMAALVLLASAAVQLFRRMQSSFSSMRADDKDAAMWA